MIRGLTYLGILLAATSMLMVEILLTRITSVIATYHLAFFVIALAMLGMTAGAVLVFLNPRLFAKEDVGARLTQATLGFAVTTPIAFAYLMSGPLAPVDGFMEFVGLLGYGAIAAVPFTLIGVTLTLALTRAGLPPGIAYAVDLFGAAAGCLLIIPALEWIDAPSTVLLAGTTAGLAALAFGVADLRAHGRSRLGRALTAAAIAGLLAACTVYNATHAPPPLRPAWSRGARQVPEKFAYVGWNTHSYITVDTTINKPPRFWARGKNIPKELMRRVESRRIQIDGGAATRMFRLRGKLERMAFLEYAMPNFAHRLRQNGSAAVIGVGGGRDVLAAAMAGHDPIVGVEINSRIVELHTDVMRGFSELTTLPGVELVNDEARSYLTRDPRTHDVITMSLIDTWAASGAGAYSLTENSLYTVEAWVTFFRRLKPDGIFTVSRWYGREAAETARMMSLAMDSLFAIGATRPRDHIMLLKVGDVATLLVSPSPFRQADIDKAKAEAARLGFNVLYTPGGEIDDRLLASIFAAESREQLRAINERHTLDVTPPTDDRPFFFNMLPLSEWLADEDKLSAGDGSIKSNLQATKTLVYAIVVSALLTAIALLWPLWRRRAALRGFPPRLLVGASIYFALIGLGFMFVEIGLLSRINVFLGQPVLALAVSLGGIILATGAGSLMSGWVPLERPLWARLFPLIPAGLALVSFQLIEPVMTAFAASDATTRILASLALIVPPGLGMGLGFPLGLRLVQRREQEVDITPWLWGINGAFGVCASGLALATSMNGGISTTLAVGTACYALLLLCTWALAPRE